MCLEKLKFGIQSLYDKRKAFENHFGCSYVLSFISEFGAINKGQTFLSNCSFSPSASIFIEYCVILYEGLLSEALLNFPKLIWGSAD